MRHEKISVPEDVQWGAPVRLRIGDGLTERVCCPSEALYYLNFRWPTVRGRHYAGAVASCVAALEGKMASEFARDAFCRACEEATVLN
jgi:hypothetical protein